MPEETVAAQPAEVGSPKKRGERGRGHIFKPKWKDKHGQSHESRYFWIQYYRHGVPYRENTHSDKITAARELLKKRLGEIVSGQFSGPKMEKVRFEELAEDLLNNYAENDRRSIPRLKRSLGYLSKFFAQQRAVDIDGAPISQYRALRKKKPSDEGGKNGISTGASNATVNRELAALRRMFHLGKKHKKVASIPDIEMLKEPPARKGFLEHEQYRNLRNVVPEHLKPVLTAFYFTGMRLNELLSITWEQVNLNEREIRLDPGTTKNDEGRTLILDGEFLEVMRMQKDKRDNEHSGCQWVFFRRGMRIKNFYKAWRTACVKAGLGTLERRENGRLKYSGLIPHDLRRTAVRNLVRAGVPERVAMEISGHKTRAIFERYNIVSRRDLQEAARRQSEYLAEKNNQSTDKITLPGHDQQATTAVSHWKN